MSSERREEPQISEMIKSLEPQLTDQEGKLISALEALNVLDRIRNLTSLEYLLETFSRVNEYSSKDMLPRPLTNDAEKLRMEISELLGKEWMSESQELVQLLNSPLIKLLVSSCDDICKSMPNWESIPESSAAMNAPIGSISDHYIAMQSTTSGSSRIPNPDLRTTGARSRTTLCSSNHYYEEPYLEPYYESIQTQSIGGYTVSEDRNDLTDGHFTDTSNTLPKFTVKLVQIVKGDEPLGITITVDEETNLVIINRLIHGGAGHRSGLISVGDVIYEINNIPLRGRLIRDILRILNKESRNESISFKLLMINSPKVRNNSIPNPNESRSVIYVKAHFDYNPCLDQDHPCTDAGIVFKKGDILEIVSQEDACWWQARHADLEPEVEPIRLKLELGINLGTARAGLIPSISLQEKRVAALRDVSRCRVKKKYVEIQCMNSKYPCILRKIQCSKDKVRKVMYKIHEAEMFESNDVPTYEEMIQLYPTPGYCRPIVIFSASKVGRNKLIRRLLSVDPVLFKKPVAHTTRAASVCILKSNVSSDWKENTSKKLNNHPYFSSGKYVQKESDYDVNDYINVSEEWMTREIQNGNFVESVYYNGAYFGVHRESIRSIIANGQVCILSLQTQGLKNVRNSLFKPFVIFLKPPRDLKKFKESRKYYSRGTGQVLKRNSLLFNSNFSFSNLPWYSNNNSKYERPASKMSKERVSRNQTPTESKCSSNYTSASNYNLNDEQLIKVIIDSAKLEYLYGKYFDVVISMEDFESTLKQLVEIIQSVQTHPHWAPASWL